MYRFLLALLVALALLPPGTARAETWPARPIHFVVGFPPGGGIDFFARALGKRLQERLGQAVVVDNRAGANGIIGADIVAKAAPDGYTVLICNEAQMVVNQHMYANMPYNAVKDFEPVTEAVFAPVILYVVPSFPAKSVDDLVALAKAHPGELSYASVGTGTVHHLTAELFKTTTGIDMLHVPYKGGGPATVALLAGDVPIGFAGYSALASARAGKLRALATTGTTRAEATADLPTFVELGYPGVNLVGWHGVLVPAHTPKEIVARLNAEVVAVIHEPDVKASLVQQGFEVAGTSPDEFARAIQAEIPIYARLVADSGAKVE